MRVFKTRAAAFGLHSIVELSAASNLHTQDPPAGRTFNEASLGVCRCFGA